MRAWSSAQAHTTRSHLRLGMQFGRLRRAAGLARQVREVSGYRPAGKGVVPRGGQGLALATFLRVPQFTTPNIVAFCTYFATFAVFFFTGLYLVEVAGASGYRLALVFLPMTLLMIAWSLLAGRWTATAGPRLSITAGCLVFAAGLFLPDGYLSRHPDYGPLMASLALAGIGIGATVVPVTSSVLSTALVVNAIETGQIPQNTSAYAGYGKIVQEVIGAAYTAFHHGLHAALYLSAGLALAAGLLAFVTLRQRPAAADW
jgi:predicted MFS family arabinose efflux permease